MKISIELDGTPDEIENLNLSFTKSGDVVKNAHTTRELFTPPSPTKPEEYYNIGSGDYDPDGDMDVQGSRTKQLSAADLDIPEVQGSGVDTSFTEGEW